MQTGKPFSFCHSSDGFKIKLWQHLGKYVSDLDKTKVVFAIEASTDVWQNLADYLSRSGYPVVLINPRVTWNSRRLPDQSFSKTDPKDALVIAQAACNGYFSFFQIHTRNQEALRTLAITYHKLKKNLTQNRARIRSMVSRYFPEFHAILLCSTDTAFYLLRHYLHADDYLNMDVQKEAPVILRISHQQHGMQTLTKLKKAARNSIGISRHGSEADAARIMLTAWMNVHHTIKEELKKIEKQLHALAVQTEYFHILTSLKGISSTLAALFIAETVDLDRYTHYKQILKLAGLDLQMSQSGSYRGKRKISHGGNRRLRWIIYLMTRETSKYIPEVRIKYLKRQIRKDNYTKNLIACTSPLLQLIMVLVRDRRVYGYTDETIANVIQLQQEHDSNRKTKQRVA
jgi:transposase